MFRLVIFVVVSGAVLGCGGGVLRRQTEPQAPASQWFCQPAQSPEAWRCVQDDDLARAPFPKRLPPDPEQPIDNGGAMATDPTN